MPPLSEEPASGKRNPFFRACGRHCISFFSFAALFLLLFAGVASLLLIHARPDTREALSQRLPVLSSIPRVPKFREVVGIFEKQQTITYALAKQGLSNDLISKIIDCARPVYNLAKVKAGQSYWLCFTQDGSFRNFRYPVDDERYLTVYHDAAQDRLVSVLKNFDYQNRVEPVSAVIDNSLFSSVLGIGEHERLALDLADIFGSDIDFYTDIQKGDWFRVLIEKKYLNGRFVKYGPILAAAFSNRQKLLTGFRFEDENSKPGYYAPDGRSMKRSFLKSPLKFARISSKFSYSRMHPVLKTLRPHLGVDYAAAVGTPVQAVGSGVVISAGYSGGSGKMVRIRHSGGYETMCLHLSRIAVRSGARVDQGQVIGYVGSTGLSTGPHLDFRVVRHGTPINPLKVIFPPGPPISPQRFADFAILRDKLNGELQATNDQLARIP
jgi:murein DD-endopeptidase MepM/ murein hydrolase activator NlpD